MLNVTRRKKKYLTERKALTIVLHWQQADLISLNEDTGVCAVAALQIRSLAGWEQCLFLHRARGNVDYL